MPRIYRVLAIVILSIFILLYAPAVPVQGNSTEPTYAAVPAELPSLASMAHQPPVNATDLTDFTPSGATVISVTVPLPDGSVTPTVPISVPVTTPFNGLGTNVVNFDQGQVAVVIEENTVAANSELSFQPLAVPAYAITTTNTISDPVDSVRLLHFQLEMIENGVMVDDFSKPVRIVLDMRSLTGNLNPVYDGNYFLAYEDENEPGLWHDVPITVHQDSGLISAEVTHFSTWIGGSRPERWSPSFVPPAVSEFSGAATYNYPIEVPPGRHGLQPNVSLSYSSRSLDGAIQDIEAGDLANGWSLAQISIMRHKVTVKTDGAHLFIYHGNDFSLVLNGVSHRLKTNGDSIADGTIQYYAKDAPGLRVWRYFDNTLSTDGLYWVVTTADGVQYRLGYTEDSQEYQQGDLWPHNPPTHWGRGSSPWHNRSAIAWNVDTVTDLYGNQMQYQYLTDMETETVEDEDDSLTIKTYRSRLWQISYNYPDVTSLPVTNDVARLTSTPATSIHLRAISDDTTAETFEDPISHILLFHNNASTPMKEYRLTNAPQSVQSSGCSRPQGNPRHTKTQVITDIRLHTNTDGDVNTNDMGYALPPVTFEYTSNVHYVHPNTNPDKSCFYFRYLEKVHNGYGGTTTFTYESDGRDVGSYQYTEGVDRTQWPEIGHNYYVTQVEVKDGRNPVLKTTYDYTQPCYDQDESVPSGAIMCNTAISSDYGNIVGFATTTQTRYDYDGSTILNKQISTFSQNADHTIGRPTRVDLLDGNDVVLNRTDTSYVTQSLHGLNFMFTYTDEVVSTQYSNGVGSADLSTKVEYFYDTADQGGEQYGNLTQTKMYDDANATIPYRTTHSWYYPNTSDWLVNRVGAEAVYDGATGTHLSATWSYYDGNTSHQSPPSKGSPTRIRQFLTNNNNCNQIDPEPANCVNLYLSAESSFAYDVVYGNQTHQYGSNEYGYQVFGNNWSIGEDVAPPTETTTQITYETGFHLYPTQATLSGPGLTTQTTTFEIYGFNGVGLGGFQEQRGLLKQVTEASGIITKYEYDPFGRLYAVYDAYDNFSGFGDTDPGNGDPVSRYTYWDNNFNNSVMFLDPANGEPFVTVANSRPGSYPDPANSSSGYAFNEQTFYDGFGRPIQNRSVWNWLDGASNSREIYSSTAYHANGQAMCQTSPYDLAYYSDSPRNLVWPASPFDTDACTSKVHTTTTYDALGRPTVITAPDGSTTTQDYLIRNDITLGGYNKLSQTTVYDANGHARSQFSNTRGELVAVREYTGNTSPYTTYATTIYGYDPSGNLDSVTDGDNNATSMTYDHFGRKLTMNDPDMGAWTYTYDAAGNLLTQRDANLDRLCFYYDSLNRLTHKRFDNDDNGCETNDTQLAYYAYVDSGGGLGNPSEIRWSDSSSQNKETFVYDSLGRLTTHNRWIDSHPAFTMSYSGFDALHRPTQITYPDGEVVTTSFDHEGEDSLEIEATPNNTPLVNSLSYNGRGQLTQLALGNGLNTTYSYYGATDDPNASGTGDSNFRLKSIETGSLLDFTYTYDVVGNIQSINDGTNSDLQTFGYDDLNRLIQASGSSPSYNHTYDYDVLGNIIQITRDGVDYDYHSDSTQPHAVDSISGGATNSFTYDNNGNMTVRQDDSGNYTQAFDVENRLTTVTNPNTGEVTTFSYDANGQRVLTIEPDGTEIYYPFPGYEEEVVPDTWQPIALPTPPFETTITDQSDWQMTTSDTPNWPLDTNDTLDWPIATNSSLQPLETNDVSGWGLNMSSASDWAADLLPWPVDTWTTSADSDFPATSLYHGSDIGDTYDGLNTPTNHAVTFSNLADGRIESPVITDSGNNTYDLTVWVNQRLHYGSFSIVMSPVNGTPVTVWSSDDQQGVPPGGSGWAQLTVQFVTPAGGFVGSDFRLQLVAEQIDGWVAWDNLTLTRASKGGGVTALDTSFEGEDVWTELATSDFPATAIWRGGDGPAVAQDGQLSYAISNLGESQVSSPIVSTSAASSLEVQFWIQNDIDVTTSAGGVSLTLNYYNSQSMPLGSETIWHSDSLTTTSTPTWQFVTATDSTLPLNTTKVQIVYESTFVNGWAAIDDVSLLGDGSSLSSWDYETNNWTTTDGVDFPAGTAWYGSVGRPLNGLATNPPTLGYLLTNEAKGESDSEVFSVNPFATYHLDGWVRGQMTAGEAARLAVHFVDGNGQEVGAPVTAWNGSEIAALSWEQKQKTIFVPGSATGFFVRLTADRIGGWVAFDEISVLDLNQPVPWYVSNTWDVVAETVDFPATSTSQQGTLGIPYSTEVGNGMGSNGQPLPFNNLASGKVMTTGIAITDIDITLQWWVRGEIEGGSAIVQVLPDGNAANAIPLKSFDSSLSSGQWQQETASFTVPSGTSSLDIHLQADQINGWVAFDDLTLYDTSVGIASPILEAGFENGNWNETVEADFPATSLWRGTEGPAGPHSGQMAYAFSNLSLVELASPFIDLDGIGGGQVLRVQFSIYEALNDDLALNNEVQLLARYYDDQTSQTITQTVWSSKVLTATASPKWQTVAVTDSVPSTISADEMDLVFRGAYLHGLVAFDDVVVVWGMNPIADWNFETNSWGQSNNPEFPAGNALYNDDFVLSSTIGGVGNDPIGNNYVFTNQARGTAHSSLFVAQAAKTYHLTAQVRGQMESTGVSQVAVQFFDLNGQIINEQPLWSSNGLDSSGWQTVSGLFTTPITATHFRLDMATEQMSGWLSFDGVTVADVSDGIPAQADQLYSLSAMVRGDIAAVEQTGTALMVYYYDNGVEIGTEKVWGEIVYDEATALLQSGRFRTPANTDSFRVGLMVNIDNDAQDGWVAYDDVQLTAYSEAIPVVADQQYDLSADVLGELDGDVGETAGQLGLHFFADDTDGATELAVTDIWSAASYDQPSTPLNHSGSGSHSSASHLRAGLTVALDKGWLNFSEVTLSTVGALVPVNSNQSYDLDLSIDGQLTAAAGAGSEVTLHFDDSAATTVSLWSNPANFNGTDNASHTFTLPTEATGFQIGTEVVLDKGHVAVHDVVLTSLSTAITAPSGQSYDLSVLVAGNVAANGGRLFVREGNGTETTLWQNGSPYNSSGTTLSGNFAPTASSFQVGTELVLDKGYLSFSDVTLATLSQPIATQEGQDYRVSALVAGDVAANGGRLFMYKSDGSSHTIWQNSSPYNDSQTQSGDFTTPAGVSSFQVGTEVVLDKGHLAFTQVALRAYGEPFLVVAGRDYETTIQLKGVVAAPSGEAAVRWAVYDDSSHTERHLLQTFEDYNQTSWQTETSSFTAANGEWVRWGMSVNLDRGWLTWQQPVLTSLSNAIDITPEVQYDLSGLVSGDIQGVPTGIDGGQIAVRYYNSSGNQVGNEIDIWQTQNFNGSQTAVSGPSFITFDSTVTAIRVAVTVQMQYGWLDTEGYALQEMVPGYTIQRSTYFLAGKAIATRISGDPVSSKNGLFFLHSDHLGSASVMSDDTGAEVLGSEARYLPFGDWRTQPTADLTDMGYTGHKGNNVGSNDIGLIYMNARYYVPTLNRFLSADVIVPDPANPQSYNRYSYSLNNPINFRDPTGRWQCAAGDDYDRCVAWFSDLLEILQNGGEVSRGSYNWFIAYDEALMAENGIGVSIEIYDPLILDFDMRVRGGDTIQISRQSFNQQVADEKAANLAHEIAHFAQGQLTAFSKLGEIGAWYVQALVKQELGLGLGATSLGIFEHLPDGISTQAEWNELIDTILNQDKSYAIVPDIPGLFIGSYSFEPCPYCQYHVVITPESINDLMVAPAELFSILGQSGMSLPPAMNGTGPS